MKVSEVDRLGYVVGPCRSISLHSHSLSSSGLKMDNLSTEDLLQTRTEQKV